MRTPLEFRVSVLAVAVLLAACSKPVEPGDAAAAASMGPQTSALAWPGSLNVLGEGFPHPGDVCRRLGESTVTAAFLDHTATLAGCPSVEAASALGGTVVGTVDGITLVSVPNATATPGEGDGQGDATVAGTPYHAVAKIRCSGIPEATEGLCEAGVVRSAEGPIVDVMLADGVKRVILFNADGSFLTFSTSEADGTAALAISSSREGDTTVATLGNERYEIPDAFVVGG